MTRYRKHRKQKQEANRAILFGLAGIGAALVIFVIIFAATRPQVTAAPRITVPEVAGAPRIAVSQDVIDHGDVRFDVPVESVFTVRNVGDQPLMFLEVPFVELVEGC